MEVLPASINDGNAVVGVASTTSGIASSTLVQVQVPPNVVGGGNAAGGVASSVPRTAPQKDTSGRRTLRRAPVDSTNGSVPGEVALPGSSAKVRTIASHIEAGRKGSRVESSIVRQRNFSHPFRDGD